MLFDVEAHPVAGFVNKDIEPLLKAPAMTSLIAPTAIVLPSPLTATDVPKLSPKASKPVSDVVSLARAAEDDHPVVGLVNTSAAPEL